MKTVLFLHGFFSSGQCPAALSLREGMGHEANVITPDLPLHPSQALSLIRDVCDAVHPDLLVGNSCGSFYAQMVAPLIGVPVLLGNPYFRMSEFLRLRVGEHTYKSPRQDGKQIFTIDESLVQEFGQLEKTQFDCCNPYFRDRIWGIFGEGDPIAHFEGEFLEHYATALHFPGAHTPTPEEVKQFYVPACRTLLKSFPVRKERHFRHFKGGLYRYICSAKDSETLERRVVYQAMYGNGEYWVRPEGMFFGRVKREGRALPRFEEID